MNKARVAAVVVALGLPGCSNSVEGTYTLDKSAVKQAMQAELAGKSGGGIVYDFFTRAVDQAEMKVELQPDGQASLRTTLPTGGWVARGQLKWITIEDQNGRWKADGQNIVITAAGNVLNCSTSRARMSCQPQRQFLFPVLLTK
jgi:hypothetical protein